MFAQPRPHSSTFFTTLGHIYVSSFLGNFEFSLDGKGRVALPSAFMRGKAADSFVLLQWRVPALTLLPPPVWEEVRGRLREYRRSSPKAWAHARRITAAAIEVSPDSQRRILIPTKHQVMASLDDAVLILGVDDRIELWNPALYEAEDQVADESFDDFAEDIFG